MFQENLGKILNRLSIMAGALVFITLIAHYGFNLNATYYVILEIINLAIAVFFLLQFLLRWLVLDKHWSFLRKHPMESIIFLLFIMSMLVEQLLHSEIHSYILQPHTTQHYIKLYFIMIQFYNVSLALTIFVRNRRKWLFVSIQPARVLMNSFLLLVLLGTGMILLPRSHIDPVSFVDALFISTSAVCVTGLSPLNIAHTFTLEGQAIILFLLQIGGLGIITLTSFVALFWMRGFLLEEQFLVMELMDDKNINSLTSILRSIIQFTAIIEISGAILIYLSLGQLGLSDFDRVFHSIFHAVSAYCNAGFSTFENGLESPVFSEMPFFLLILSILIILGGLGFYTQRELFSRKRRYTLQSRIILISSILLIVFGMITLWIFQFESWRAVPVARQALWAFFSSVTSRTAGFSIIDIRALTLPATMIILLLMYVGAAPNSTGGGIKITTAALLTAAFLDFIRGRRSVDIGWDNIPMTTIRRAFVVLLASLILLFTSVTLLTFTEKNQDFMDILFEAVSAFGTVGLSRGITANLSSAGKLILVFNMFLGRIGLFTFAIAAAREQDHKQYNYPETDVMVG